MIRDGQRPGDGHGTRRYACWWRTLAWRGWRAVVLDAGRGYMMGHARVSRAWCWRSFRQKAYRQERRNIFIRPRLLVTTSPSCPRTCFVDLPESDIQLSVLTSPYPSLAFDRPPVPRYATRTNLVEYWPPGRTMTWNLRWYPAGKMMWRSRRSHCTRVDQDGPFSTPNRWSFLRA